MDSNAIIIEWTRSGVTSNCNPVCFDTSSKKVFISVCFIDSVTTILSTSCVCADTADEAGAAENDRGDGVQLVADAEVAAAHGAPIVCRCRGLAV